MDLLFYALSFGAAGTSKPIAEWIFHWRLFLFLRFLTGIEGEVEDHIELGTIFHIPLNLWVDGSDVLLGGDGVMHAVIDQKIIKFILIPFGVVHQLQFEIFMNEFVSVFFVENLESK